MSLEFMLQKIAEHTLTLDGWCTPEKAVRMARAVIGSNATLSVELGVYGGRGAMAMAMAHKTLQSGVTWGFDPWSKEAALEGKNDPANDAWWAALDLESIYRVFIEKMHAQSLFPWLYFARLKSEQAVTLFKDETIDVLHLDGNHSEKVSCMDVRLWSPKVKVGGIWFADDIDWPTTKKSQELLLENGFKLLETHGSWAVYQKVKAVK